MSEDGAISIDCPHCMAKAGSWCTTATGRVYKSATLPILHQVRKDAYGKLLEELTGLALKEE